MYACTHAHMLLNETACPDYSGKNKGRVPVYDSYDYGFHCELIVRSTRKTEHTFNCALDRNNKNKYLIIAHVAYYVITDSSSLTSLLDRLRIIIKLQ